MIAARRLAFPRSLARLGGAKARLDRNYIKFPGFYSTTILELPIVREKRDESRVKVKGKGGKGIILDLQTIGVLLPIRDSPFE